MDTTWVYMIYGFGPVPRLVYGQKVQPTKHSLSEYHTETHKFEVLLQQKGQHHGDSFRSLQARQEFNMIKAFVTNKQITPEEEELS
jgi:hypothetical protein